LLGIVEAVTLEATSIRSLIGTIFALGLSVATGSLVDAVSIGTLPLVSLAAAFLVVIEWVLLEAAFRDIVFTHGLVRAILALDGAITVIGHWDAVTISTGPIGAWASALGNIVEWILAETTLFVTFIRSISALGFAITVFSLLDAVSIGTLPFRFLAAAFLVVVEIVALEAA
jgi:hypothetical protein